MKKNINFFISSYNTKIAETTIIFTDNFCKISIHSLKIFDCNLLEIIKESICKLKKFEYSTFFHKKDKYFFRLIILNIGNYKNFGNNDDWIKLGSICRKSIENIDNKINIIMDIERNFNINENIKDFICGFKLKDYNFDKYKTQNTISLYKDINITLQVNNIKNATEQLNIANKLSKSINYIRDLVNEPANILNTKEFLNRIKELKKYKIDIEIFDKEQLIQLGLFSIINVAQGSSSPPYLVVMKWNGCNNNDKYIALVGKGVVFDSGGISIKPSSNMDEMKGDMAGAATVVGIMKYLALRNAKINVIGVLPIVENMPSGNALRPGDIIKSLSGQTIEVINTDAEGRIILADALWFTKEKFKPKFMINFATLTGAILIALGNHYAGFFTNNDILADRLYISGIKSGENVWRMPLSKKYDKIINSKIADIKNCAGRNASSITAAQFLQRFVGNTPWIHLDIAGTATNFYNEYNKSWASGFGLRLIDYLFSNYYENKK